MPLHFATLLAQATTSTTEVEVERIVGDHPGNWVVLGASVLLLALILLGGLAVRRRASASDTPR